MLVQQIGNCYLIYGDCLEVLRELPITVHAVVTDPPYGVTRRTGWDKQVDMGKFFEAARPRVKADGAWAIFTQMPFTVDVINAWRDGFRYDIIWHKAPPTGFLNARLRPLTAHEIICIFGSKITRMTYNPQMTQGKPYKTKGGRPTLNYTGYDQVVTDCSDGMRQPQSVIYGARDKAKYHPTQKSQEIVSWLVKTYSNENEFVLDPFMGSGSTGVACMNSGRAFVGIEQNKDIYNIACERIRSNYESGRTAAGDSGEDDQARVDRVEENPA